jgi:hypothetical protein
MTFPGPDGILVADLPKLSQIGRQLSRIKEGVA